MKKWIIFSLVAAPLVLIWRPNIGLMFFGLRSWHVPSAAMEPTIKVGDRVLGKAFKGKPKRGDIAAFFYPKDRSIRYIKRVVGIPGDKIKMMDNIVYLNGDPVPRASYDHDRSVLENIHDDKDRKMLFQETLGDKTYHVMQDNPDENHFGRPDWPGDGTEFMVPENHYFFLGDNRDNSTDSRFWKTVPGEDVTHVITAILYSLSDDGFRPERILMDIQ